MLENGRADSIVPELIEWRGPIGPSLDRALGVHSAEGERAAFLPRVRRPGLAQKRAVQTRIVLAAAAAEGNEAIARCLGCSRPAVGHRRAPSPGRGRG
jgi:hypothetical protein